MLFQLLRLTGGRLNEIVRLRLDQFLWTRGKLRLYATKTENQRELPLWDCIKDVAQRRISESLTDGELLFPRAKTATFDNAIARACRKAAKVSNLDRKSTRLNSSHSQNSYAVFCLIKKMRWTRANLPQT